MKLLKIFIAVSSLTVGAPAWAQQASSVLSVSDNSMTPSVVMPESFETDTKAMLENWYLRNYTVLDYKPEGKSEGDFSDETLLERLGALPTEIEMPLNSVVKNTIMFYARRRQLVENMLGLSLYYMPIFEEALERHKMPLELKYLPDSGVEGRSRRSVAVHAAYGHRAWPGGKYSCRPAPRPLSGFGCSRPLPQAALSDIR